MRVRKKDLPRRKELAKVCFDVYGTGKNDKEDVQTIIIEYEQLLIDCGFISREGVIKFALGDVKKLRKEFFESMDTRRMAAAAVFQTSLRQGIEIQQQMYNNVVETNGGDADSGRLWNQTTDTLAKLTGAYAPEKVASVRMGEGDEVVSIADVIRAREEVVKRLPEGEDEDE